MSSSFDFEKAVEDLLKGKTLAGKDGVLTPLIEEGTGHRHTYHLLK